MECTAGSLTYEESNLIRFVRGADIHQEDSDGSLSKVASSQRRLVLGDTFHSEIVAVGPPSAGYSSDVVNFGKSESYFRYVNGYAGFSMRK